MRKLVLAFAMFWVRIYLKLCKSTEMEELRNLIKLIANQMTEIEENERGMTNSSKSISSIKMAPKAIAMYLDNKANSQNTDDWLEVARCDVASEKQLKKIAKKCINLHYYYSHSRNIVKQLEIANALFENPNTTANVMVELCKSSYITVVYIGYLWLEQYLKKHGTENDESAMSRMMQYLESQVEARKPENWIMVAKCVFAEETHLIRVAENCVIYLHNPDGKQSMEKIAALLEENPQTTEAVMKKLTESQYEEVKAIGARWLKQHME